MRSHDWVRMCIPAHPIEYARRRQQSTTLDNKYQNISNGAENSFSGVVRMQKNVGGMDRIVRLVVGIVLIAVALAGFAEQFTYEIGPITTMIGSAVLAVVGLILVVTGGLQQCVLNDLLGIDTYQP